jgi:ankyrin repeat protein
METPHPIPALHFAAMTGNLDLIGAQLLLGANVNDLDHQGLSPLHLAAQCNQLEGIAALCAAPGGRHDEAVKVLSHHLTVNQHRPRTQIPPEQAPGKYTRSL